MRGLTVDIAASLTVSTRMAIAASATDFSLMQSASVHKKAGSNRCVFSPAPLVITAELLKVAAEGAGRTRRAGETVARAGQGHEFGEESFSFLFSCSSKIGAVYCCERLSSSRSALPATMEGSFRAAGTAELKPSRRTQLERVQNCIREVWNGTNTTYRLGCLRAFRPVIETKPHSRRIVEGNQRKNASSRRPQLISNYRFGNSLQLGGDFPLSATHLGGRLRHRLRMGANVS